MPFRTGCDPSRGAARRARIASRAGMKPAGADRSRMRSACGGTCPARRTGDNPSMTVPISSSLSLRATPLRACPASRWWLIGGEPMVLHVARRGGRRRGRGGWRPMTRASPTPLQGSGVRVAMTSAGTSPATDRLAECARIAGWADDAIVVNLQGDEPFAPADGIALRGAGGGDSGAGIATPRRTDRRHRHLAGSQCGEGRAGRQRRRAEPRAGAVAARCVLPEPQRDAGRPLAAPSAIAPRPLRAFAGCHQARAGTHRVAGNSCAR